MKPKELIAAVRKKHPEASKKEIVRAAFYALSDSTEGSAERAQRLHAFAIGERSSEEDTPMPKKLRNGTSMAPEVL